MELQQCKYFDRLIFQYRIDTSEHSDDMSKCVKDLLRYESIILTTVDTTKEVSLAIRLCK